MASRTTTIDYLALTIAEFTSVEDVIALVGLEFSPCGFGNGRYRDKAKGVGHPGQVFWNGIRGDMGVHVDLTGKCLRLIEMQPDFEGWPAWLSKLIEAGARFARLDIALDDRERVKTPRECRDLLIAKHAATSASLDTIRESCTWKKGIPAGTVYVGSAQSERMMRIYDKTIERDGFEATRYELVARDRQADAIAKELAAKGMELMAGFVRGFLEFKDETHLVKNSTERRCAQWWADIVGQAKHVIQVAQAVSSDLDRTWRHFKKQYAQFLGVCMAITQGSTGFIERLAEEGSMRLNAKNRLLIAHGRPLANLELLAT